MWTSESTRVGLGHGNAGLAKGFVPVSCGSHKVFFAKVAQGPAAAPPTGCATWTARIGAGWQISAPTLHGSVLALAGGAAPPHRAPAKPAGVLVVAALAARVTAAVLKTIGPAMGAGRTVQDHVVGQNRMSIVSHRSTSARKAGGKVGLPSNGFAPPPTAEDPAD